MEWSEYIDQVLSSESSFDGIRFSFNDGKRPVGVPPIIKASILMLDRMQECQGNCNIIVFPERIQSAYIFTLTMLLHNISEGRIGRTYDPDAFSPGERLKFGKAIVEFVGTEERDGKKYMKIRLAEDLTDSAPIDYFPLFQKINTHRKLSKNVHFVEAKKEARQRMQNMTTEEKSLQMLADYKTHMNSSIVYMTAIINTKELIAGCKLCGQQVNDIIMVSHANYEGNIQNISAGQLDGTPAIVLASDLYSIVALAEKNHPIQSVVIDASNTNTLLSQLDALDTIKRLGVPITCVTDTANSFDFQPFIDRQFSVWRWDQSSITESLYDVSMLSSDCKIKNCAKQKVEYLTADGNEISTSIKKLYLHRNESKGLSSEVMMLSDRLFRLAFTALRETVPYSDEELTEKHHILADCSTLLSNEMNYLAPATYEDYSIVISCLKMVFVKGYSFPKHDVLANRLHSEKYRRLCIIVPEGSDRKRVQEYWQTWCRTKRIITQIYVHYPVEYYSAQCSQFSAVVVVGWLKRAVMRKILYCFNTPEYNVLLYDYEKRWKGYDTSKWNAAMDSVENKRIIDRSFSTEKLQISTFRFTSETPEKRDIPETDELTEIEVVLRENKYRQYLVRDENRNENEITEAIPVNYAGGYLAFYRSGHKVISVSNIINNDADKIDSVLPSNLKIGDFVVVRESDHDLIREMADIILERSGKPELRGLATKWKEALEIEQVFHSTEEIYHRLQQAGCTKGYATVRGWLQDDVIAPQSKEDLALIAEVTGSDVLKELLDQIYEAAQTIKSTHVQAGRALSAQLRGRIVESLKACDDIDPFNIWDPIEMYVDGIGTVRILKIIDIGTPVIVDIADTNRLIDE